MPKRSIAEPLLESPGWLIRRAYQLVQPHAAALFPDDEVTLSQIIALRLIGEEEVTTAAGLARYLTHDTGAMTRMVDQLDQRGLVLKASSPKDGRVTLLSLSSAGEEAVAIFTPRMTAFWNDILSGFGASDRRALLRLLGELVHRLEESEVAAPRTAKRAAAPRRKTGS